MTTGRGSMAVVDVPEPDEPGPGELLVRPEAVGVCGSDLHYFLGDLGTIDDPSSLYPRVQGHEFAGIVEAAGPGCPPDLARGRRVAVWPLHACGACYPCRIGRGNACADLSLIGVHRDGALQELLRVPAAQAHAIDEPDPRVGAFVEPTSIAVRTVVRGRVAAGERVLVLGAGPIGIAVALAALDRGASVLVLDRIERRLELGAASGAELARVSSADDIVARARAWTDGAGPEVVVEATGAAEPARAAIEAVAPAGRVVAVGLSRDDVPIRLGALPHKELDLLGVSCCDRSEFAEAARLVARRRDAVLPLLTHEFALEEAPRAIAAALERPSEVVKAVVRVS